MDERYSHIGFVSSLGGGILDIRADGIALSSIPNFPTRSPQLHSISSACLSLYHQSRVPELVFYCLFSFNTFELVNLLGSTSSTCIGPLQTRSLCSTLPPNLDLTNASRPLSLLIIYRRPILSMDSYFDFASASGSSSTGNYLF